MSLGLIIGIGVFIYVVSFITLYLLLRFAYNQGESTVSDVFEVICPIINTILGAILLILLPIGIAYTYAVDMDIPRRFFGR